MSNFSVGLICAKKELFNSNYEPDKVVKCFLLIDFQRKMIGIRSVDTQFSAIICIEASDLIRVQKNDFDIHHETEIESERLTNTIDLVLLSNNDKVL